jgi:enoyl-CoA hydratase/carnithine racemase
MAYDGYQRLRIVTEGRLVTATIDNPPINLITRELYGELARLAQELEADDGALVFVLKSANPDFFMAHFDVEAILSMPTDTPPARAAWDANAWHVMCERFRTMGKVTIAQIEGRVGGGGAEISASFDMRFGALGRTIINQMEVPVGILPGGTGTQRLPRLLGRGRAMEVVLGGIDLDAETAERWGWLNRALPPAEVGRFVDALARRIAGFPPQAVRLAKRAVLAAEPAPHQGLAEESFLFQQLIRTDEGRQAMRKFLELGGQTREGELRVAEISGAIAGA